MSSRSSLVMAATVLVAWLEAVAPVAAGQLSALPSMTTVAIGETATVSLVLTGPGAPVSILDVAVRYDQTVLHLEGVTFGGFMGSEDLNEVLTFVDRVTPDTVTLFGMSFLPSGALAGLQADSATVATLEFTALGPGTSPVAIEVTSVGDGDADLESLSVVNGTVTVTGLASSLLVFATANKPTFGVAQTLKVTTGIANPGLPGLADLYAGILRPGGTIEFISATGNVLGDVGDLASFRPFVTGASLATPFAVTTPNFYSHQWTGAEPRGGYVFFLAVVRSGALDGGAFASDDVLGLVTVAFTFP